MNKKFLVLLVVLLVLWILSRRRDTSSSVKMTSGGENIFQDCRYSNGALIHWPVSQGPCPLTHVIQGDSPGQYSEGVLLISGAGISK